MLIIMLSFSVITNAQIGLPGDGDVDDVPEAPISMLIPFALVAATVLGVSRYRGGDN